MNKKKNTLTGWEKTVLAISLLLCVAVLPKPLREMSPTPAYSHTRLGSTLSLKRRPPGRMKKPWGTKTAEPPAVLHA